MPLPSHAAALTASLGGAEPEDVRRNADLPIPRRTRRARPRFNARIASDFGLVTKPTKSRKERRVPILEPLRAADHRPRRDRAGCTGG